jgi:hypothetical protein
VWNPNVIIDIECALDACLPLRGVIGDLDLARLNIPPVSRPALNKLGESFQELATISELATILVALNDLAFQADED